MVKIQNYLLSCFDFQINSTKVTDRMLHGVSDTKKTCIIAHAEQQPRAGSCDRFGTRQRVLSTMPQTKRSR